MRSLLTRLVGGGNEAHLARSAPIVARINELEAHYEALTDEQIREEMAAGPARGRRGRPGHGALRATSSSSPDRERRADMRRAREQADTKRLQAALDDVLPDVFAAAREVSRRKLGMRPFDVQLMGAIVLHQGRIAEMKTGEGKTLVAPLAAALNAMSGRGVHVVTVNDYLAKRDPQWMGPIFHGLGLSVGIIQHDSAFLFDPEYRPSDERLTHLRPVAAREAYAADVTYATNNELGFDYLRDNMVTELAERVQRERYFAIVDEVDNILIDEARTPLIISGQAEESDDLYYTFARLVPRLEGRPENATEGGDYFVDLKEHAVSPTEEGIDKIEQLLGVRDLFDVTTDPRLRAPLRAGAARARAVQARPRLHRQGRRDRHRRRVHRPPDARPPLVGGTPPGDRGQGGPARPARVGDPRHDHLPELLPAVREAVGHDRHGHDRAGGVLQDLRPRGRVHPDPPADGPRRRAGPRLPRRERQVQGAHRRGRRDAGGRPARCSSAP